MAQQPFAVFDIDGTIFRSSLIVELTTVLLSLGVVGRETHDEFREAYDRWRKREGSYDDYITSLVVAVDRGIAGIEVVRFDQLSATVVDSLHRETYRYTRNLIEKLRKTHFLIAISASPEPLVKRFAKNYKFDAYHASPMVQKGGVYTGEVRGLTSALKDEALQGLIAKHNLTYKNSCGVGDSDGDIHLLQAVTRPIAFNPDAVLVKEATKQGWPIVVERKNVMYRLEKDGNDYRLAKTITG